MDFESINKKVQAELEINNLGDHKLYKFINQLLNKNHDLTLVYMTQILGFKSYQVNKIRYNIDYRRKIYRERGI